MSAVVDKGVSLLQILDRDLVATYLMRQGVRFAVIVRVLDGPQHRRSDEQNSVEKNDVQTLTFECTTVLQSCVAQLYRTTVRKELAFLHEKFYTSRRSSEIPLLFLHLQYSQKGIVRPAGATLAA